MKRSRLLTLAGIAALVMIFTSSLLGGCSLSPRPAGQKGTAPAASEAPLAQPVNAQTIATSGPTASLPSTTPAEAAPIEMAGATTEAGALPEDPPKSGLCGKGTQDLLVLGLSAYEADELRGADAIRLVHADFGAETIRILALPPRLLAGTPALSAEGIATAPLNQVYLHGKARAQAGGVTDSRALAGYAARLMAETISTGYGFKPQNYAVVDPQAFARMVDSLGGVEIDNPKQVEVDGIGTYETGIQKLDGQRALDYVRLLTGSGEPDRIARQNLMLRELFGTVVMPANWLKAPGFLKELAGAVATDLNAGQLTRLGCVASEAGGAAPMLEIPPAGLSTDADGNLLVDPAVVQALVEELLR